MEKGVDTAREKELDDIEEEEGDLGEEEDDEDEDEDDDEDEDEEPEPIPDRRPVPRRKPPTLNIETKEDLKTLIMEKFQKGLESWEINVWLRTNNIPDPGTGEFLTVHQIGGYKSLTTPRAPATPLVAPPAQEPEAPATAQQRGKVIIPRPRTKLDTFVEMMTDARASGDVAMAQIAVDGIYKCMDSEGGSGGGMNNQIFELLKAQLEGGKGRSKLDELEKVVSIVKNLMPEPTDGKSEAVQMAEVMERSVHDTVMEVKDTALRVSGSKDEADKMGKCPKCTKLIPMDSSFCPYCGLAFKQKFEPAEEEEEEEDPAEAEERQRQEEAARKRSELARRLVKKGSPAKPQPPAQPTPQPAQQPTAPTPTPANPPAGQPVTPAERESILRNLKKLANFVAAKDDPVLKTQALFKAGDNDDRKTGLFLAIIGREKLLASAHRLIKEHPELAEFQNYVDVCDSADGQAWIDTSFEEIKKQSKLSGLLFKREEAAEMLSKVEARLGFAI
jgi:hypothetical protein